MRFGNLDKSILLRLCYPYAPLQELIGEIILATHSSKDVNASVRFHKTLEAILGPKQKLAIRKSAEHEKNLYFIAQLVVKGGWTTHKACEQMARKTLVNDYFSGESFRQDNLMYGKVRNLTRKLERDFSQNRKKYENGFQEFCNQYAESEEREMIERFFTKAIIDAWLLGNEEALASRPDLAERYKRS